MSYPIPPSNISIIPEINQNNTFYIDLQFGDDSTGDGSLTKPFKTYSFAMEQVPDIVNGWLLQGTCGEFAETDLVLRPNVHFFAPGLNVAKIDLTTTQFTLSPEFDGVTSKNQFTGISFVGEACNFVGTGMTLNGQLLFVNCNVSELILHDLGNLQCASAGAGGIGNLTNNLSFFLGLSTTIQNIGGSGCICYLFGIPNFQSATFDNSLGATQLLSRASPILGSISLDGAGTTWDTDAISYTQSISLTGGATVSLATKAEAIKVTFTPTNYIPSAPTVEANLVAIDEKLDYLQEISFNAQQLSVNGASAGLPPLIWDFPYVASLQFANTQHVTFTLVAPIDIPGVTAWAIRINYYVSNDESNVTVNTNYFINRRNTTLVTAFQGTSTNSQNSLANKVSSILVSLPSGILQGEDIITIDISRDYVGETMKLLSVEVIFS